MSTHTDTQTPGRAALAYAAALSAKFADSYRFEVALGGRKFAKITQTSVKYGGGPSVHCFVDLSTGALLKSESWTKPARGPRGDLSTPQGFAAALKAADQHGAYLYAR